MTEVAFISRLQTMRSKADAIQLAGQLVDDGFSLHKLVDITFHRQQEIGFRAAWVLEQVAAMRPQLLHDELDYFLQKYPQVNNHSVRRHFSKLLMWLLAHAKKSEEFSLRLWQHDLEAVLAACFDWLIDPHEKVAVKVQCMDCIFLLSEKYPWALEELIPTVDFLQRESTPAMRVRVKRLLVVVGNKSKSPNRQ